MPNCAYCGQAFTQDSYGRCSRCGAGKPEPEQIEKYDPFFYDGYIVYALRDRWQEGWLFIFYQGDVLKGRVHIDHYEMMANVPEGCEYMSYVMKKFEECKESANA